MCDYMKRELFSLLVIITIFFACSNEEETSVEILALDDEVTVVSHKERDKYDAPLDSFKYFIAIQTNSLVGLIDDQKYFNRLPKTYYIDYVVGPVKSSTVIFEDINGDTTKFRCDFNREGKILKRYQVLKDETLKLITEYKYDNYGRLIETSSGTSYQYNEEGKLLGKMTSGNKVHSIKYSGDSVFIDSWLEGNDSVIEITNLNKHGQIREVATHSTQGLNRTLYHFNDLGFVKRISKVANNDTNRLYEYSYDANGIIQEAVIGEKTCRYDNSFGNDYGFVKFLRRFNYNDINNVDIWLFNELGDWVNRKVYDEFSIVLEIKRSLTYW